MYFNDLARRTILPRFLMIMGVLAFSLACGGGGGSSPTQVKAILIDEESDVEVLEKATLAFDLKDYMILQSKSKFKAKSTLDQVTEVFLDVWIEDKKVFTDLSMIKTGDGRYEIALFRVPLGKAITFQIKALDDAGGLVMEAREEKTLDLSLREQTEAETAILDIPLFAVVELSGRSFSEKEIQEIVKEELGDTEASGSSNTNEGLVDGDLVESSLGDVTESGGLNESGNLNDTIIAGSNTDESATSQDESFSGNENSQGSNSDPENAIVTGDVGLEGSNDDNFGDLTESGIFQISTIPSGLESFNKTYGFWATLEGKTMTLKPEASLESVSLRIESYGRSDNLLRLDSEPIVAVSSERMVQSWANDLEAWWENRPDGLEQGFVIRERPVGEEEQVELRLGIEADRVEQAGETIFFLRKGKSYKYEGLKVWDALGKTLNSKMYKDGLGVVLSYDDTGAIYPVTVDPVITSANTVVTILDSAYIDGKIDTVLIEFLDQTSVAGYNTSLINDWDILYGGVSLGVNAINIGVSNDNLSLSIYSSNQIVDTAEEEFQLQYNGASNVTLGVNILGSGNQWGYGASENLVDGAYPVLLEVGFNQEPSPPGTDLAGSPVNSANMLYSEEVIVDMFYGGPANDITTVGDWRQSSDRFGGQGSIRVTGLIDWDSPQASTATDGGVSNVVEKSSANLITAYINAIAQGFFDAHLQSSKTGPDASSNIVRAWRSLNNGRVRDGDDVNSYVTAIGGVDANGNLNDPTALSLVSYSTWNLGSPSVVDFTSFDLSGNGYIDTIELTFSSNIVDDFLGGNFSAGNFNLSDVETFETAGELGGTSYNTNVLVVSDNNIVNDEFLTVYYGGANQHLGTNFKYLQIQGLLRDTFGNKLSSNTIMGSDNAQPRLMSVDFGQGVVPSGNISGNTVNTVTLTLSENVIIGGNVGAGNTMLSTPTLGDMTTAGNIEGLIAWSGVNVGDMTTPTGSQLIVTEGNVITVYINGSGSGYYSGGTSAPSVPSIITVSSNIEDAIGLVADETTAGVTVTNTTAWDVTAPTLDCFTTLDIDGDGGVETLDLVFSENIIDLSITNAEFALSLTVGGANVAGASNVTLVDFVGSSNLGPSYGVGSDNYFRLTLGGESVGTGAKVLAVDSGVTLRDTYGNRLTSGTNVGTQYDQAKFIMTAADFDAQPVGSGNMTGLRVYALELYYSEIIQVAGGNVTLGGGLASASNLGDMTNSGNVEGLVTWTAPGNITNISGSNWVEHTSSNSITVYINGSGSGYFTDGGVAPAGGLSVSTQVGLLTDLSGLAVIASSVTGSVSRSWDNTSPAAINRVDFNDVDEDGGVDQALVYLSDNVFDLSIRSSSFSLSTIVGGANVLGSGNSTTLNGNVTSNDNLFVINFPELQGTEMKALGMDLAGVRDVWGNRLVASSNLGLQWFDLAKPVLVAANVNHGLVPSGNISGNIVNSLEFVYSENILVGGGNLALGSSLQSAGNLGDLTIEGNVEGVVTFVGNGSMVSPSGSHIVEHSAANVLTIYINGDGSGYFSSGNASGNIGPDNTTIFTAYGSMVADKYDNRVSSIASVVGVSVRTWDVEPPDSAQMMVSVLDENFDGDVDTVELFTFSGANILDLSIRPGEFMLESTNASNVSGGVYSTVVTNIGAFSDADDEYFKVTMSANLTGSDNKIVKYLGDTLRDLWGNRIVPSDNLGQIIDSAPPVIVGVEIGRGVTVGGNIEGKPVNTLTFTMSETILVGGGSLSVGDNIISASNLGDTNTANLITGFSSWTGNGDLTSRGGSHRVELSTANIITLYINGDGSGYFNGGVNPPDGTSYFSGVGSMITDVQGNPISSANVQATITQAWETSAPLITNVYTMDTDDDGSIDSVDVVFSENIIDLSIDLSDFALDSNSTAGGNTAPSANVTMVTFPSSSNVSSDNVFNLTFSNQITGTGNKYLFHSLDGLSNDLRDDYGNRLVTGFDGPSIDKAQPVLLTTNFTQLTPPVATDVDGGGNVVNAIRLGYSENVHLGMSGLQASSNSTMGRLGDGGAIGDGNQLSGLIQWSETLSDPENESDADNVIELSDNVVTVYLNANRDGIFIENPSAIAPNSSNTVTGIIADNTIVWDDANWPVNGNVVTSMLSTTAWNVTRPTIIYPLSITSTRTSYDLSTYQPVMDFSEDVMFAGNTENYHISDNAGYADLTSSNLALASVSVLSLNQVQLFFGPSGNRFKSGNLQFDLDSDIRDIYGNPFSQSSDNVEIGFLVGDVAHYDFEDGTNMTTLGRDVLEDSGAEAYTGGLDAVVSGAANISASSNWIIDGNAMFLGTGASFEGTNLDDRNFPQLKGSVEFWVKTRKNPVVGDVIFGDTNTPSGNYFAMRYSGTGSHYRITANGAAAGSDNLGFDLGAESWNHIAFTFNEAGEGNVITNGVMAHGNTMSLIGFNPTDQDVIFSPLSDVDNIRVYDILRNETQQVDYINPFLKASYPIDEAFDLNLESTQIVSDNLRDYDAWVSSGTNLVVGHHNSGNSMHLRDGLGGLMTFGSNLERHLFPRFREGSLYFWVRPNHTNDTNVFLLDNGDLDRNHFYIQCTGNVTEYKFVVQQSDGAILDQTTFQLQDYAWNHLAITWNLTTGSLNLHINGSTNLSNPTVMNSWTPDGQEFTLTPHGYIDDLNLTNVEIPAGNFQTIFNTPTYDNAYFDFEGSSLPTNDIGWEYWASSGNYNPMFFNGGSPIFHEPHYGETSGNSLFFPDGVGMSVYSLESDFFPSGNGTMAFWWKPEYRDDSNTIEVLGSNSISGGNLRNEVFIESSDNLGNYRLVMVDANASSTNTFDFQPIMERWNHVAVSWGDFVAPFGNDFSFYLNGVEANFSFPLDIGNWRPTGQIFSSTPHGALDDVYVESDGAWDEDRIESEYFSSIRNIEEGYLTGGSIISVDQIFYGFSTHENTGAPNPFPSFSTNLLSERNESGYGANALLVPTYTTPQNYARLNADYTGNVAQKDYADDVELSPTTGYVVVDDPNWAMALGDQESFWVPSLDYERFPQDHGTIRFWVKPEANAFSGSELPQVFGGNQIDSRRKQNFFSLHGKTGGKYDFEVYENGGVIGSYQDIELHPNAYNHVAVSWSTNSNIGTQSNLILFINGRDVYDFDRGSWSPSDQLFVSTPYGSLDSMYLEGMARDDDFINNYFLTYVTPAGFYTFEDDLILDRNTSPVTANHGYLNGSEIVAPTDFVVAPSLYHSSSTQHLDLYTTAGSNFEVPSLLKDLFPQEEGVVRYWLHPNDSAYTDTTTRYLFDYPEDRQGEHFFIQSLGEAGKFRFALQGVLSSNIISSYDFWVDSNDWTHLAFNWSEERDTVNLLINGEVRYTAPLGTWRPAKQKTYIEPKGMIDDLFISYIYESVHEIREYYYGYRPEPVTGYVQQFGQGTLGQLGNGENSNVTSPELNHNLIGVLQLAGGEGFGLALMQDTTIKAWGQNNFGQLGDNTLVNRPSPVSVPDLNGVVQVAAGKDFSLAVLNNGTVYGWGNNSEKQLGLTGSFYKLPQKISSLSDITKLSAGSAHSLGLHRSGTVYGWGLDLDSQIGSGNMSGNTGAYDMGLFNMIDVAAGANHSLMLNNAGSISSLGADVYGQLGDGAVDDGTVRFVGGGALPASATNISASGEHSVALLSDGSVVTWGRNDFGQLGQNTTTELTDANQNTSANTVSQDDSFTALGSARGIMAGQYSGYALLDDGSLKSWGRGLEDQLGNSKTESLFADNVTGVSSMDNLSLDGWKHAQGIVDGNVYYLGFVDRDTKIRFENNDGSDTGAYNFPARFYGSPEKVEGQGGSGNAWRFESGEYLEIPGLSGNSFPQTQGTVSLWYTPEANTPAGTAILDSTDASRGNGYVLRYDGSGNVDLYTNGALLSASNLVGSMPVTAGDNHLISFSWDSDFDSLVYAVNGSATSVTASFATWRPYDQRVVSTPYGTIDDLEISTEYTSGEEQEDEYYNAITGNAGSSVFAWGENSYGQLGDGTTTNHSSPVTVDFGRPQDLGLGLNFSLVLLGTGNVMVKGDNFYGQLGDGTYINKSNLIEIGGFEDAVQSIAVGDHFGVALLSNGNLMTWGRNNFGQLGHGTSTPTYNVPTTISSLTNVVEIAAGSGHVLARLSNNDVYAWGRNDNGQLGLGDIAHRDSPTKISSLANATQVACGNGYSMALIGGFVYIWGDNNYAQLGDGSTNDNSTPSVVAGIANVTQIAAGHRFALALNTADQVLGWGSNQYDQIGSALSSLVYSPEVIATISGIDTIVAGTDHALLLLDNETVMSWGRNAYGQLGQGDYTNSDTPTLISGMSAILRVKVSRNSSFTIQR